jgi:hypothetical protein
MEVGKEDRKQDFTLIIKSKENELFIPITKKIVMIK